MVEETQTYTYTFVIKKRKCSKCGKGLNPWWSFCPICGTPAPIEKEE